MLNVNTPCSLQYCCRNRRALASHPPHHVLIDILKNVHARTLTFCHRVLFLQGSLRVNPRGDDSPDWLAVYSGANFPGSRNIHILQVLRHAFLPAPFVAGRRDRP